MVEAEEEPLLELAQLVLALQVVLEPEALVEQVVLEQSEHQKQQSERPVVLALQAVLAVVGA